MQVLHWLHVTWVTNVPILTPLGVGLPFQSACKQIGVGNVKDRKDWVGGFDGLKNRSGKCEGREGLGGAGSTG